MHFADYFLRLNSFLEIVLYKLNSIDFTITAGDFPIKRVWISFLFISINSLELSFNTPIGF